MSKLTKAQVAAFEKQGQSIDAIFRNLSGLLAKGGLDRKNTKKLVQVNNFLNKASNLLSSIHSDDEEGDEEGSDE